MIICPKCNSNKIIRNGHPNNKKQQYFCKKCNSYFYEHEPNKLPPTTIPFPFIAKELYSRKRHKMSMRVFRKFVNRSLVIYQIRDGKKEVSRQTIHYWINKYGENFENIISEEEAEKKLNDSYEKLGGDQKNKEVKWKIIWKKKRTYKERLETVQWVFGGREKALECAKKDKDWYEEIIERCMYYELPEPEYEVC